MEVTNDEVRQQFHSTVEGQRSVLDYELENGTIVFTHTGVPPPLEGRGIGTALAKAGLDYARSKKLKGGARLLVYPSLYTAASRISGISGRGLLGFLNLAVANAGGANTQALASTFNNSMDILQIQVPATLRHIMGVADATPELRSATADFTNFCHKTHSRRLRGEWRKLYCSIRNIQGARRAIITAARRV